VAYCLTVKTINIKRETAKLFTLAGASLPAPAVVAFERHDVLSSSRADQIRHQAANWVSRLFFVASEPVLIRSRAVIAAANKLAVGQTATITI
jgi:hypothetical protein